jgi:hypothetical protein
MDRATRLLSAKGRNTLFIVEWSRFFSLVLGGQWAGSGVTPFFGATVVVLGVFERAFDPSAMPDYFRLGQLRDPSDLHRYHFWSMHPGGANWANVDGSVRFFSYNAGGPQNLAGQPYSPTVVEALATRSSAETVGDW